MIAETDREVPQQAQGIIACTLVVESVFLLCNVHYFGAVLSGGAWFPAGSGEPGVEGHVSHSYLPNYAV